MEKIMKSSLKKVFSFYFIFCFYLFVIIIVLLFEDNSSNGSDFSLADGFI